MCACLTTWIERLGRERRGGERQPTPREIGASAHNLLFGRGQKPPTRVPTRSFAPLSKPRLDRVWESPASPPRLSHDSTSQANPYPPPTTAARPPSHLASCARGSRPGAQACTLGPSGPPVRVPDQQPAHWHDPTSSSSTAAIASLLPSPGSLAVGG